MTTRASGRSGGAMPPGFDSFDGDDLFETFAPPTKEEAWRKGLFIHGVVTGISPGKPTPTWGVRVGKQYFEVLRVFGVHEAMVQKPGAKRKAFNVRQNGPVVELREQKGTHEATWASPILASVPFEDVRVDPIPGRSGGRSGDRSDARMTPEELRAVAALNQRLDTKFKQIVADEFLTAMAAVPRAPRFRKWSSNDGALVRLYYGDAYLTVHHDGISGESRGAATFYTAMLRPGERVAYNKALKDFYDTISPLVDWQIKKRARETGELLASMRK